VAEREWAGSFEWQPPPSRLKQNRWKVAGVAALAASLLIGLTVAWSLVRNGGADGTTTPDQLASPEERALPEEKESVPAPDVHEPQLAVEEPPEKLVLKEASEQLAAAMEKLTAPQRRVLLLRYYGEMSFAEIAETMDCPLNTALSHCRRGLLTLKKILVENAP